MVSDEKIMKEVMEEYKEEIDLLTDSPTQRGVFRDVIDTVNDKTVKKERSRFREMVEKEFENCFNENCRSHLKELFAKISAEKDEKCEICYKTLKEIPTSQGIDWKDHKKWHELNPSETETEERVGTNSKGLESGKPPSKQPPKCECKNKPEYYEGVGWSCRHNEECPLFEKRCECGGHYDIDRQMMIIDHKKDCPKSKEAKR